MRVFRFLGMALTCLLTSQAGHAAEIIQDCENCPSLAVVKAGQFQMGAKEQEHDEAPIHTVTIPSALAVGVTEVTRDQFSEFVEATGHDMGDSCWTYHDREWIERSGYSWRSPGFDQTGAEPVVCVSWLDAKAYTQWLSEKTGKAYRLLTEAEWEYAARGNSKWKFTFGNKKEGLCAHANGAAMEVGVGSHNYECSDGYRYTAPPGDLLANRFGLEHMAGNVREWVLDCYQANYRGTPVDGGAAEKEGCQQRVLRGGSWVSGPQQLRLTDRYWYFATDRLSDQGFRVVRLYK